MKEQENREEEHWSILYSSTLKMCHLDTDGLGQGMVDDGRDIVGAKTSVGGCPRALVLSHA